MLQRQCKSRKLIVALWCACVRRLREKFIFYDSVFLGVFSLNGNVTGTATVQNCNSLVTVLFFLGSLFARAIIIHALVNSMQSVASATETWRWIMLLVLYFNLPNAPKKCHRKENGKSWTHLSGKKTNGNRFAVGEIDIIGNKLCDGPMGEQLI